MASESESEKRETLADIVAEMRTRSREVKEAFGGGPDGVENMLDIWADRIEAVWKRQEKTYLDQIRDAMNMWGHEKHIAEHAQKPKVGNAAAMREAIIKALTLIQVCDWPPGVSLDGVAEVVREIDSALDKPPRQCDVGTAEEQEERFKHFCASNYSACDVDMECCRCPLESEKASCEFAWAQMPYAAEEGAVE